jgi:hypothetical protein
MFTARASLYVHREPFLLLDLSSLIPFYIK